MAAVEYEKAPFSRRAKGKGALLALVVCLTDHKEPPRSTGVFKSLCDHLVARDETATSVASLYRDQHERRQTPQQLSMAFVLDENASSSRRHKGKDALLTSRPCLRLL
jgi:hypothetical protein